MNSSSASALQDVLASLEKMGVATNTAGDASAPGPDMPSASAQAGGRRRRRRSHKRRGSRRCKARRGSRRNRKMY